MKLTRPVLAALVALMSLATIVAVAQAGKRKPHDLLPDLVQEPPSSFDFRVIPSPEGDIFRLGFRSSVHNSGAGQLEVHAHRSSTKNPAMSADQIIHREDGTTRTNDRVGVVQYTRSPTHSHWHYLRFERYEIRSLDGKTLVTDHKSGFCVGDRYDASGPSSRWSGEPRAKYGDWWRECGKGHPEFLKVTEGMSVGWGDDYWPHLEGQFLDLNGLPEGEYLVVHRVNVDRKIEEERYDNNEACARLTIAWPNGPTARPAWDHHPC
jgi:hypothetical protein